ncbi:hypothetical protein FHS27_001184 [Rhodopirellula rubra]|uniref:Uncharacterized protein n=1 Tax=Aporhodopirellula rubra TaxID=980271 RepID=A0A7W5DWC1_9BACT|nr:hypothetical protein [Aporhodopirellula rubra]MBB3205384.1 hypothetical protein [Aporhodopirellula rubra]
MMEFVRIAIIVFCGATGWLTTQATDLSAGITARFHPEHAHPGEAVELRVEMNRTRWGQFELHVPSHSELHSIAIERVPVEFSKGQYRQRESLLFQPVASGTTVIEDASVSLTTAEGTQQIELPALQLEVAPFGETDLQNTPEPLPAEQPDAKQSPRFAATVAAVLSLLALLILGGLLIGKRAPEETVQTDAPRLQTDGIIRDLKSGTIPRDDLERLLHDPQHQLSHETRSTIERTLYAHTAQVPEHARDAAALASTLQTELQV